MMFWTWLGLAVAADTLPQGAANNPAATETTVAPGAAPLVIDAKVPVEVLLEGVKLAQLYFPGEVTFYVAPGPHLVRIYTNGDPTDVPVALATGVGARIVVGRSGISLAAVEQAAVVATGPVPVEFRFVGNGGAQLRIDSKPHSVQPGHDLKLDLPAGVHPISVRSTDGTAIWASGSLEVVPGRPMVVQLSEGRLPEVSGAGAYHAGGG